MLGDDCVLAAKGWVVSSILAVSGGSAGGSSRSRAGKEVEDRRMVRFHRQKFPLGSYSCLIKCMELLGRMRESWSCPISRTWHSEFLPVIHGYLKLGVGE